MVIRKEIRTAHNKGKPNKMESVEVLGVPYRSVWIAWQALKIGGKPWRHEPFREELKRTKSGRLSYTDPFTGKTYPFRLIPYNPKL
jgi:hypothetical protein